MASSGILENPTGNKTLFIKTYGCQMNVYDSERITDVLACRGYGVTNSPEDADLVIINTLDGRVIALDDESGDEVWSRQVADGEGESMTMAPVVIGDNIITANSAGDWGTRGWVESLKVSDGSKNWRMYTIPAPGEPGSETWLDDHDAWKTGGGSKWVTGSADLEQNVYIFGTGNPVPMYDPEARPGDNLFTNSVIAADLDTGEMKWYFQYTPGPNNQLL